MQITTSVLELTLFYALGQHRLQIINIASWVVEILQKLEALLESSKDGEFTVERIIAKEQVEHGVIVCLARFPVSVRHRNLIQICEGISSVFRHFVCQQLWVNSSVCDIINKTLKSASWQSSIWHQLLHWNCYSDLAAWIEISRFPADYFYESNEVKIINDKRTLTGSDEKFTSALNAELIRLTC